MFRTDKHGRTWMIWRDAPRPTAQAQPYDPLTDGLDSYREKPFAVEAHYGVERLLDDTLATRNIWGRVMDGIRVRTARALLERSCGGKAFVMTLNGEHRLVFVSDHTEDDHELSVLLRAEIDKLLESDDYRALYEFI